VADPWAFGWTQALALLGMGLTAGIAYFGFRTFDRWKREKIEERKIETAFDALALAYESKYVFEHIRGFVIRPHEYADMPREWYSTEREKDDYGPFYAIFRRLDHHHDFFESAWKLQPRCMAILGKEAEAIFDLLHTARRDVHIANEMLLQNKREGGFKVTDQDADFWIQLRADRTGNATNAKEGDRIGKRLEEFRSRMEALCNPIIAHRYGVKRAQ
jgi:hypothetical protein